MRISNVLKKPIATERTVNMSAAGKYVFEVNKDSSKGAIANEVEKLYGVEVVNVRTMIMPGKPRRIAKTWRHTDRKTWKKAIVTLKKGQTIDLLAQS
jgi:large subunit ribosomal protein L23